MFAGSADLTALIPMYLLIRAKDTSTPILGMMYGNSRQQLNRAKQQPGCYSNNNMSFDQNLMV